MLRRLAGWLMGATGCLYCAERIRTSQSSCPGDHAAAYEAEGNW
jgi:hypothetical protein